jgi:hypothetical protein
LAATPQTWIGTPEATKIDAIFADIQCGEPENIVFDKAAFS